MAIQRIQTDHGSEFGTDFTWHLQDVGILHRRIPRGCPESNGKVERSHRTDADEFYRRGGGERNQRGGPQTPPPGHAGKHPPPPPPPAAAATPPRRPPAPPPPPPARSPP